jgi:hypothetical protein
VSPTTVAEAMGLFWLEWELLSLESSVEFFELSSEDWFRSDFELSEESPESLEEFPEASEEFPEPSDEPPESEFPESEPPEPESPESEPPESEPPESDPPAANAPECSEAPHPRGRIIPGVWHPTTARQHPTQIAVCCSFFIGRPVIDEKATNWIPGFSGMPVSLLSERESGSHSPRPLRRPSLFSLYPHPLMHSRVQALQEEHSQLRALLRNCESAGPRELPAALRRLQDAFEPLLQIKLKLYADSVEACERAGDKASITLLGIFRTNMNVASSAVLGFLRSPDPNPGRSSERFRAVATTLRLMLSTEEQAIFPIFVRHALSPGGRP